MGLFDNVPPGSFPPGGSGLTAPKAQDYERTITRTIVDGGSLRVSPELEKEYQRVYWAERTLGMSDTELEAYLIPRRFQIIDPYPDAEDTLH